jgi:hypothetical protein
MLYYQMQTIRRTHLVAVGNAAALGALHLRIGLHTVVAFGMRTRLDQCEQRGCLFMAIVDCPSSPEYNQRKLVVCIALLFPHLIEYKSKVELTHGDITPETINMLLGHGSLFKSRSRFFQSSFLTPQPRPVGQQATRLSLISRQASQFKRLG